MAFSNSGSPLARLLGVVGLNIAPEMKWDDGSFPMSMYLAFTWLSETVSHPNMGNARGTFSDVRSPQAYLLGSVRGLVSA